MTKKPYYVLGRTLDISGPMHVVMISPVDKVNDKGEVTGVQMGGPVFYADSAENAEELANILCEWEAAKANG